MDIKQVVGAFYWTDSDWYATATGIPPVPEGEVVE